MGTVIAMNSDTARQRAENSFKKQESASASGQAATEHETRALAICEKTERLKALRLAKEAQEKASDGDK